MYTVTAIPFCVWMMKGYFDTIPKELEESALIDGASQATIFFRIILPLAKPAVAVTALFSFMTAWNEFIQAATFMNREDDVHRPRWACASSSAASPSSGGTSRRARSSPRFPSWSLFMFLQKYLISGLTAGAVKG